MAVVKPFRALRYADSAGPLEDLVAPPYDVISAEQREKLRARSPHNVVHLTLPDSEEEAARELESWRAQGILVEEPPAVWALEQDYVGPDGVARTRFGIVASLKAEPYETGTVLPHERTHAGPKEGRLRLLRATRVQLEPIFLLYDADPLAAYARVRSSTKPVFALLLDQSVVAGCGLIYANEVLFRAGLSPTTPGRSVSPAGWQEMWDDLRALMKEGVARGRIDTVHSAHTPEAMQRAPRVDRHGGEVYVYRRPGQPCLVCGTPVQRLVYADNESNYCPGCQTGGRLLADRALSRLLKDDWPRTLEELEARKRG